MNIYVNGDLREVPENLTLATLLDWLKLPADRVAVELNREIASRSTWAATTIQPDDRLEVVHFVGGGTEGGWPQPSRHRRTCSSHDAP